MILWMLVCSVLWVCVLRLIMMGVRFFEVSIW